MKFRYAIVLLPALLGCGDSTPPKPPEKPKISESPPASSVTAEPIPPPRLPDAPAPLKASDISRPATTDRTPAEKSAPGGPVTSIKKPDEFDPDMVGGKPIGAYVKMLDSANKDDVIEALNALRQVPKKAEKNSEKITALTKNKDKEIADEATLTLKAIGNK